jgi:putative ABC transport system permease protein
VWRATWKSLWAHKFRLALTALSVVLGVAFVAGTYVLTDTMNAGFDQLFQDATAGIDVQVRAEAAFVDLAGERGRIPEDLLETVRGVDGVALAEGSVAGYAQFVDKDGEAIAPMGPPTLGVSWPENDFLTAVALREGEKPTRDGQVAMDAGTAEQHGFRVGDTVRILFLGPPEDFEIVGIFGFGQADNLGGATAAAFDTETAQRVLGAEGEFDTIEVVAQEGVSPDELRDRLAPVLPKGVEAASAADVAEEQSDALKEGLGFFNTFLLVFAGISLFVGAFIIFNTFNILITQRTRELALLRAIGASGAQVMRSVMIESLMVGLFASIVGLGLGLLVAMGLQALLSALGIDLPSAGLQLQPRTVIVSVVVGVVVTFVSAIFPARRAARVAPIAALRAAETDQVTGVGRRAVLGVIFIAIGVGTMLVGLFADVPNAIAYVGLGVALTFIGVAAFAPAIARPLSSWIGAPVRRLRGVPGKLARENAMRNPKRTASTAAALMIGLALVATFAIMGASVKASTVKVLGDTYRADFTITSQNGFSLFSPEIAARLREREELGVVSEMRFGQWRDPETERVDFVIAVDPSTLDQVVSVDVTAGSLADLSGNAVALDVEAAESAGVSVGDTFPMEFAKSGEVPMRVAAIYEPTQILGARVIGLDAYGEHFREQLDQSVLIETAPEFEAAEGRQAVEEVTQNFPGVVVQDQAEYLAQIEQQVDALLNLVYSLLFLAIFIALLGIVNTLALSVYERTRELGLLRALGLSRRQTRSMVRWESVLIAVLGGILGVILGLFFGWALVTALSDEGITELAIPGGTLIAYLVVAGIAGVLAAVGPARRAAKLDVLQAISYE